MNMERSNLLKNLMESIKLDAYVEAKTSEMHVCMFCGRIGYKDLPMKRIGGRWICIDCLRELKEALETLAEWEQEINLKRELKRDMVKGFNQ